MTNSLLRWIQPSRRSLNVDEGLTSDPVHGLIRHKKPLPYLRITVANYGDSLRNIGRPPDGIDDGLHVLSHAVGRIAANERRQRARMKIAPRRVKKAGESSAFSNAPVVMDTATFKLKVLPRLRISPGGRHEFDGSFRLRFHDLDKTSQIGYSVIIETGGLRLVIAGQVIVGWVVVRSASRGPAATTDPRPRRVNFASNGANPGFATREGHNVDRYRRILRQGINFDAKLPIFRPPASSPSAIISGRSAWRGLARRDNPFLKAGQGAGQGILDD